MSITEEQRHRLIRALQRELGEEEAATLMEHLPPVGWADVATKRDLDHQDALLRAGLRELEATFEARLQGALNRQTMTLLPGMGAMLAVFAAASSLF